MYEHIALTDAKFVNILNACPDLYPRTMTLNGVSKAYSMTGWRIGYAAGPENIITAMENVQSQSTSNPTSISQVAAEAALNGDQGCITPMLKAFRERHVFVVNEPEQDSRRAVHHGRRRVLCLPGYACGDRQAVPARHDQGSNRHRAFRIPAGTSGVAVVPGSAFGSEGYVRLSFATSMDNLSKALERLAKRWAEVAQA